MNVMKLKGKMREMGMTQQSLARQINIDKSTLSRRLKDGNDFTIEEVNKITYALKLTDSEATEIFLH